MDKSQILQALESLKAGLSDPYNVLIQELLGTSLVSMWVTSIISLLAAIVSYRSFLACKEDDDFTPMGALFLFSGIISLGLIMVFFTNLYTYLQPNLTLIKILVS